MIFGASDFSIRALSVAVGLATLIALYFLIKRLYNSKAALLSVFFVAFSPLFIKYSQEARMYTLVALLAIVSIRAYYEAFVAANSQKKQTTWRRLYILFIALGMWTQYLSALTVLALWAFRLYQVIKKQPKSNLIMWREKASSNQIEAEPKVGSVAAKNPAKIAASPKPFLDIFQLIFFILSYYLSLGKGNLSANSRTSDRRLLRI